MTDIRPARLSDLRVVASWLISEADCVLWAGDRVSFPVDLNGLPHAIEWETSDSWSATIGADVVAFGQLVPKPDCRVHLARLIAAPTHRGTGLGRRLTTHLLMAALSRQPEAVSLNVARTNQPALALYHSLDFVEAPRPPDERPSDSLYMEHVA
jgi:GNAT superfamily N-acetyltransferase